jgi:hypothetical protein
VWVDLDAFYSPPDLTTASADETPIRWPLGGDRPGAGGHEWWKRSTDGRWFGRCSFNITDRYGAVVAGHRDMLVPAHALQPREPA